MACCGKRAVAAQSPGELPVAAKLGPLSARADPAGVAAAASQPVSAAPPTFQILPKGHSRGAGEDSEVLRCLRNFVGEVHSDVKSKKMQTGADADKLLRKHVGKLGDSELSATAKATMASVERGETPDRYGGLLPPLEDHRLQLELLRKAVPHDVVLEADGQPVKCLSKEVFQNWGRTQTNTPSYTFIPTSKVGVCSIVKWAKAKGLRVRASGYRHSWSDLFSEDGQVLISTLPLNVVEDLPAMHPGIDPNNELQGIEILKEVQEKGQRKAWCKIGPGTTNDQFRRWVISNSYDSERKAWKPWWTLPLNIIMVEITFGGANAPICHGAGLRNPTLSDLVRAIEFVNARGELQVVDDPELLKSVGGCFGMMGIVTSLTLALDALTFAKMQPHFTPVPLAIPPPPDFEVPNNIDMSGITKEQLAKAQTEMVERIENDYYSEWFWFAMTDDVFVHTWNNDGDASEAVDYPGDGMECFQNWILLLSHITNMYIWPHLPAKWQTYVLGHAAVAALPTGTIVTPLIDALHFQRGIQNMRVRDMEWEIPIPPRQDDPNRPDYSIINEAWWAVIKQFYRRYNSDTEDLPMRLALEMRMMAGSEVTMAPQHNAPFGICSIEVLTPNNVDQAEWQSFMQETVDEWNKMKGPDGSYLNSRTHWAKQWEGLVVRGKPIMQHMKDESYVKQIPIFGAHLAKVAEVGGYKLEDAAALFGNETLFEIYGSVYRPPTGAAPSEEVVIEEEVTEKPQVGVVTDDTGLKPFGSWFLCTCG